MFSTLKIAVAKQFEIMKANGLYRVEIDKDAFWATYLASFPVGMDPIYKERTQHDCNCCKSFIRAVGGMVSIINGKMVSLWDITVGDGYQPVVDALAAIVHGLPIDNIFLATEKTVGTEKSFAAVLEGVTTWQHFHLSLPANCVLNGDAIGIRSNDARTCHDVFLRGLKEITTDSIETVLELIGQNSLYRGEEHTFVLESFLKLKRQFAGLQHLSHGQDLFAWSNSRSSKAAISRIRGSVIGTLLTDLSEGKDLEYAVKGFESKVAPTNYKRPTALVTPAMVKKAQATIEELGFTSALERRYANLEDITINNILFADRSAKKVMNVFDDIASKVPAKTKNLDRVEEVGIVDFLEKILPKAESIEVMFENHHAGNLLSLVAPVDPGAKNMFKWSNNFSWSYAGEVTDSIKERVKQAGGSIVGDLCCRLAWEYTDDLDFHMEEPVTGFKGRGSAFEIDFRTRRNLSPCGGILDVDANGADGQVAHPVENIFYSTHRSMRAGIYVLKVHNYSRRSSGIGFEAEVEFGGKTHHMVYDRVIPTGTTIEVARIQYTLDGQFWIISSLPSTQASKQVWGIPTQTFQKVNVVMLSPNCWDLQKNGNLHYFFMLENCLNEGQARGFFNEFLTQALDEHRKVIEMVGAKMKTEESNRQLSGLGFSSTQRNSLLCRVKGSFNRVVKINF